MKGNNLVPFLDLKATYTDIRENLIQKIDHALSSGTYIGGSEVEKFEVAFSDYVGTSHCISVGNGYDALKIILKALELPAGSKIIIPNNTFIATALSVVEAGHKIVLADVDPKTRNLSVETIDSCIQDDVKAVIAVHLYGMPAPVDEIKKYCDSKNIVMIEDAAQAHGSSLNGKTIGAGESICAWSFYPGKNLGAFGDAGAITTGCRFFAQKCREIANYGSSSKYIHESIGINSRLDPIQAVILSEKLKLLDKYLLRREQIANTYLTNIENKNVLLPAIPSNYRSSWHLFVVQIKNEARDEFIKYMQKNNIQTSIHYPRTIQNQNCFSEFRFIKSDLIHSEEMSKRIVSLPIGPHMPQSDVHQVIETVNKWCHCV